MNKNLSTATGGKFEKTAEGFAANNNEAHNMSAYQLEPLSV